MRDAFWDAMWFSVGRACMDIAKPVCYVVNLICTLLFEGSEEMHSLKEKCIGAGGDGSVMLCKFYGDVSEALSHCLRPTSATYGHPLCARI